MEETGRHGVRAMTDEGTEKINKSKGSHELFVSLLGIVGSLLVIVALFAIWSYVTYGDIRSGWLWFSGYKLVAEQYRIDLGEVPAGESKPITFRLRNLTGEPVLILGVETDCSCLAASELPVTIPPRKTWDFEVLFMASESVPEEEVIRQMILNISVDQPIMLLEVRVKIVPNNKEKQNDP